MFPTQQTDVVTKLEREWPLLLQRPLPAAFASWRHRQSVLRRFDRVSDLLPALHQAASVESDPLLLALLVLAADDPLAGRVVLQAILPALKTQARTLARRDASRDEIWELLLYYAWSAIRTYPTRTRLRKVAANLVLQVLHDTTRELARNRRPAHLAGAPPTAPATPSTPGRPRRRVGYRTGLVFDGVRAGVISRRDAALILRSRVHDVPLAVLADEADVPYDALRKRRQRAERALRQWRFRQRDVPNRRVAVLTSSATRRPARACRPLRRRPCERPTSRQLESKERF